jgi:RimJ/RimL family protein N-acetyltransferase
MILVKNINSKNLIIKSLNLKNFNVNYPKWLNDKKINRFLEARLKKYNLKDVKNFIINSNKNKNCFLLGIFFKKNNLHIGNIKIDNISQFHSKAIIGILIGEKKYWNKGFATETIKAVTKFSFSTLKIKNLFAGCYDNNTGSYMAFKKAGWKINSKINNYWRYKNKRVSEVILSVSYKKN